MQLLMPALAFQGLLSLTFAFDTTGCFGNLKDPVPSPKQCGTDGTVLNPQIKDEFGAPTLDECKTLCFNQFQRNCRAFTFVESRGLCTTYNATLKTMQYVLTPEQPGRITYARNCFDIMCGKYCSFAPERAPIPPADGELISNFNFEDAQNTAWTFGGGGSITDACSRDTGEFPYDGINMALLNSTRGSAPFIRQLVQYEPNVVYNLSYRVRILSFTRPDDSFNTCTLELFSSAFRLGGSVQISAATSDYELIFTTQQLQVKKGRPRTIQFIVACALDVETAVHIDTISLVVSPNP